MEHKDLPFFSIVIPTKNRPNYLRDSIQSVLLQNSDDYELIVSDNFNEQATQDVINEFKDHPRFNSIRTSEELNMINHWEFATLKAKGKYVILLADRKMLYQGALKKIKSEIDNHPDINAFSFGIKVYNDEENKMGWDVPSRKTQIIKSKDLIQNFLSTNYYTSDSLDAIFPKTLNGCYKNEIAQKARDISGHYFNNENVTTPDYSSLFINLALAEKQMYICEKLMLWQGESTSNGRQFGAGKVKAYMDSLGITDPYAQVLIKAPIIYNLLIADFLRIKSIYGGNLQEAEIDLDNYFTTNYWDILQKKKLNIDAEDFNYFNDAFEKSYKDNATSLSSFSKEAVEARFHNPVQAKKFDKVRNLKAHLKDFVSHRLPNNKMAHNALKINYKSGLEAAGFKIK
tara:strand:- start:2260 stop:3459 length:1200 start_codon:yes stop_codon:yes gene_type:complete